VIASSIKVNGSAVDASYQPTDEELSGTAILTMASGDEAGRNALALMQSLRDVETRVPKLVLVLMTGGVGSNECHAKARPGCAASTVPEDIVSSVYLDAFRKLNVELLVMQPIPATEFTRQVAGGLQGGWGMAFNKLRVFGLTQFRKLLWMDADTLVLRNVDHLLAQPEFTAAFTNDCNNGNAAYKISGGMWVLEPSEARMKIIDGIVQSGKLGEGQEWRLGDMEIVLFLFAKFTRASREDGFWPSSYDLRQGRTPGVELYDARYAPGGEKGHHEAGPLPGEADKAKSAGVGFWFPLDVRYDYLVQECGNLRQRHLGIPADAAAEIGLVEAAPGRPWGKGADDLAAPLPAEVGRAAAGGKPAWKPTTTYMGYDQGAISLHYSCMAQPIGKPSDFTSEQRFVDAVSQADVCARRAMVLWYSKYLRALGGKRFFSNKNTGPVTLSEPATAKISLNDA
jgi:hypothetical protein